MTDIPTILDEIAAERRRQIDSEGWSQEHDDADSFRALKNYWMRCKYESSE